MRPIREVVLNTDDVDRHYTRLNEQDRLIEEAVKRFVDGEAVSEHYLAVPEV